MTQTSATPQADLPARPVVPNGEEIFTMLMSKIEPDLVLDNVEREQKYAGETPAEQKQRMQRYKQAFASYKTAAKQYFSKLQQEVSGYRKVVLQVAEEQSRHEELIKLKELEAIFNS